MAKKKTTILVKVFLLTGGTGRTCEQVLNAALAQFEGADVEPISRPGIRTIRAAQKAVREAAEAGAVIFHSVVEPKVRKVLVEQIKKRRIPTVDVLGPVLTLLDDQLEESPRRQPGLSYQLQREQFDRIDAVDFTLEHDDGSGLSDLHRADVVIVGVSRVSKSVTCFYLSYRGIRAANVPLIAGHEPPVQLLEMDPNKVIGLTMNPNRLQSVREARIEAMGHGPFDTYGDRREIAAELRAANTLYAKRRWRSIDVSYRSTEEVAREVLAMIGR